MQLTFMSHYRIYSSLRMELSVWKAFESEFFHLRKAALAPFSPSNYPLVILLKNSMKVFDMFSFYNETSPIANVMSNLPR